MGYEVVLSVGSNCSRENVEEACCRLSRLLMSADISQIYETPAVNGGRGNYSNAVVRGETDMDFETLNSKLKQFELSLGRTPELKKSGIVPIDVDIVIFDGVVVREWDFRQTFFRIGFSELAGSMVEKEADSQI